MLRCKASKRVASAQRLSGSPKLQQALQRDAPRSWESRLSRSQSRVAYKMALARGKVGAGGVGGPGSNLPIRTPLSMDCLVEPGQGTNSIFTALGHSS